MPQAVYVSWPTMKPRGPAAFCSPIGLVFRYPCWKNLLRAAPAPGTLQTTLPGMDRFESRHGQDYSPSGNGLHGMATTQKSARFG